MLASLDLFQLARPLLHRLEPETAHELGLRVLECGLVPDQRIEPDPILATAFHGWPLVHPLGLAAGFDKNARVVEAMFAQGFSSVEVGGVTPRAQTGNPRPRVFRLPDEHAVINRMGFPNQGAAAVETRLRAADARGMLGVNLAANGDSRDPLADFVDLTRRFSPLCDYLMLDISCPNTENGRIFLEPERLRELIRTLKSLDVGARRALFVAKLSPDIDDNPLATLVEIMADCGIDAICVANTTLQRPPGLGAGGEERGGLSGPPLREMSTRKLAFVRACIGPAIPLIGVGGIATGADAYEKIRAGATLLQLYTAMVYRGPRVIVEILRDLGVLLRRDGFTSVTEGVGVQAP